MWGTFIFVGDLKIKMSQYKRHISVEIVAPKVRRIEFLPLTIILYFLSAIGDAKNAPNNILPSEHQGIIRIIINRWQPQWKLNVATTFDQSMPLNAWQE